MGKGESTDSPLLRAVVENIGEGILVLRPDFTITFVNEFLVRLVNSTREELLGGTCYEVLHHRQRVCEGCPVQITIRTGEPAFSAQGVETEDGFKVPVALSAYPIIDHEGRVTQIVEVTRDNTKEKKLEEELRKHEEKCRMLIEKMNDGFGMIDAEGRITMANPKLAAMFEYDVSELIGRDVVTILDEANRKIMRKELEKRRRGEGSIYEMEFTTKSGRKLPTLVSATPLLDRKGEHIGAFAVITDMSDRRKLEKRLKEYAEELESKVEERTRELKKSEKKYRSLVETSPDAIFFVDRKSGKITDVNDAVCRLLGYSRDEIIGTASGSRVVSSQKNAFKREFAKHQKGEKFSGEFELVRKDGSTVSVDVKGSALGDYLFAFARDITEQKRAEEKLRENENRLRTIIEAEPECVKIVAPDGTLLDMNPAGLAMIEAVSLAQVRGKSIYPLVTSEYRPAFKSFMKGVFRGKSGKMRFEIIGMKGTRRWLEAHAVPLRGVKNKIVALLSVTRDITERKRTEDEIKALKEFNEKIVETSPIGIHVVDKDFVVRSWNSYFEDYTTIEKEDIIGKNLFKVIPAFVKSGWAKEYREVIKTGKPFEKLGYKYIRSIGPRKGEVLYQNARIVPLKERGKIVGAITILEDVTKRKLAEEKLRESEETYRSLFQNANDGIVTIDRDGKYRLSNPNFCEITGYTREELDGKHFSKIVHPDDVEIVEKNRNARINGKRVAESYEYRIISKDRKIKYVETRPWVIKEKGKVTGVQTIIRDITEKKMLEKELTTLLDMSQNISTALELDSLLDVAVKKVVEATEADRVSVLLFDQEGRARVPAACTKSGEKNGCG